MIDAETSLDASIGISALLGLWIAFSPFLLRFRSILPPTWSNLCVGAVIAVFSAIRISAGYRQSFWSWCTGILSLWVIVSPFVLKFSNAPTPLWNDVVVGAVLLLMSWRATRGLPVGALAAAGTPPHPGSAKPVLH